MFNSKSILITGGTGTFGKYFLDVIVNNYTPKKIIIFLRDEYKQFKLQEKMSSHPKFKKLRFYLGDVRDVDRLNMAFREVDYVIHAAAMKQIPSTEKEPLECIKTNINGAENVIKAAINNKVKKVIALSTDKAVNPVNLYGATKLASDKLFVSANLLSGNIKTKFSVVRYGNVISSRGSVIPIFLELKKNNSKYIPITNSEMTRFVITKEEAIQFVIDSFKIMNGGEVFIPKIPSVNIIDLAKTIHPKAKIKIIGIRQGEKIHESLFSKEESHLVRQYKKLYVLVSPLLPNKNIEKNSKKVSLNFEYNSGTNLKFLNKKEILNLL
jgi:UDP-N-acetylglucosamine 4,6-dehydratase/5-epimerase